MSDAPGPCSPPSGAGTTIEQEAVGAGWLNSTMPKLGGLAARAQRISEANAPWLRPADLNRRWAVLILTTLYALYFGHGVWAAIRSLVDPDARHAPHGAHEGLVQLGVWSVLLVVLLGGIVAALRWAGAPEALRLPRTRRDWVLESAAVLLWCLVNAVGQRILVLLRNVWGQGMYPLPTMNGWGIAEEIQTSLSAGPAEELLFGACAVTLLRRARISWPVTVVAIAAAHIAFHVYYGWPVLGFLVWVTGAVAVYALTGRVWGVVVLHSLLDVGVTFHDLGSDLFPAGPVIALAVVLWGWDLYFRHRPRFLAERYDRPKEAVTSPKPGSGPGSNPSLEEK